MLKKPRTIVDIDGFNLYYGAVKDTPYKWLNLRRYFEMIRKFTESRIECTVADCLHTGRRKFKRKLEKGTDVNIAVQMLNDAYQEHERGAAVELREAAHQNKTLPLNLLKKAQFPSDISDGTGGVIRKPAAW